MRDHIRFWELQKLSSSELLTSAMKNTPTMSLKVERVPTDTRDKFKSVCAGSGENMRDVIICFMEQFAEYGSAYAGQGLSSRELVERFMQQFATEDISKAA